MKVSSGFGLEIEICTGGCPFDKPVPQLLAGLILIVIPSPVDKSDVTVTLLFPTIQLLPVEKFEPIDHPFGSWYS